MLQECTLASCNLYGNIPHTTNHKNTLEVKPILTLPTQSTSSIQTPTHGIIELRNINTAWKMVMYMHSVNNIPLIVDA